MTSRPLPRGPAIIGKTNTDGIQRHYWRNAGALICKDDQFCSVRLTPQVDTGDS